MPLDIGNLKHRLTILKKADDPVQDSTTGALEYTWEEMITVWGSFEPLSVKDHIAAAAAQEKLIARAQIRYRSDVTACMRIRFRDVDYEIKGPPLPDLDTGIDSLTLMLGELSDE